MIKVLLAEHGAQGKKSLSRTRGLRPKEGGGLRLVSIPTPCAKPQEDRVLLLSCPWRPAQLDTARQTLAFLRLLTLLSPTQCLVLG